MTQEESLNNFLRTIALSAKLVSSTENNFFIKKFNEKVNIFALDFLMFILEERSHDVAQCQVLVERCLADIDTISDVFKELNYLNILKPSPLLLNTELSFLTLKSHILTKKKLFIKGIQKTKIVVKEQPVHATGIIKNKFSISSELNDSKKKILDYIKSFPNTRTKDIIYEFNSLSGRTVKRNLTDLTRAGFIKKKIDNKAVYYYASEITS